MLVWDEVDVLAVLETEPVIETDCIWYTYCVKKDGLELKITIYQYDGDVYFELFSDGIDNSIFSMNLMDCAGVKRRFEKSGEYLEFAPSGCFKTSRYDGEMSIPYGVRVSIKPSIKVELYG